MEVDPRVQATLATIRIYVNKVIYIKIHLMPRTRKKPYSPRLSVSLPSMLVDNTDEVFRHVLYLMLLASSRLANGRDFVGRTIGLKGMQYLVLLGTAHGQGTEGVTIRNLAQYLLMKPTHVTTEVGGLIRKGLLRKKPNGEDRRSVLVSLTPKGERAMEAIAPMRREFNNAFFVGVQRKALLDSAAFLEKLARNSELGLALINQYRKNGLSASPRQIGRAHV